MPPSRKRQPAIAAILQRQFKDRDSPKNEGAGLSTSVHNLCYHGEEVKDDKVILFGPSVKQKAEAQPGGLYSLVKIKKIVSRDEPEDVQLEAEKSSTLVRLSPDLFPAEGLRPSTAGVSLQARFSERMQLQNLREVEVEIVERYPVMKSCEITIRGRFLSQRMIWLFHRHLLEQCAQNRSPVLHLHHPPPDGKFLFRAKVTHIDNGDDDGRGPTTTSSSGSALYGLMGSNTQIRFRSKSAHMVLLIELSQEMHFYSVSGAPYYERAVSFVRELLEKLHEEDRSETYGHDLTIIVFGRCAPPLTNVPSTTTTDSNRDVINKMIDGGGYVVDADEEECDVYAAELEESSNHVDWYDVLWEGPLRALPPAVDVATKLRNRIVLTEQPYKPEWPEKPCGCSLGDVMGGKPPVSFNPTNSVSFHEGCSVEALHMALNNIDNHHTDRKLHVTGHTVMLVAANHGVLSCRSRALWEMTQSRYRSTGVSCQFVCLREPP